MYNLISPPPGFTKVKDFNDLLIDDIQVCQFTNPIGSYVVVTRDGFEVKGMVCMSQEQADDVFNVCVNKAKSRYVIN
jgi:hypothetical protein